MHTGRRWWPPFIIDTKKKENIAMPGNQKPALTQEQYERGREVLDGLPPGVYLKCSACGGWQHGGEFSVRGHEWLCEKCSRDG